MNKFSILSKAIEYIEDNLLLDFSRDDIANNCYVSLSYLEKLFIYAFDRGIKDYILKRRMTEAARDLVNGASVTNVAMKYHYNAIESFSRAFKSIWNINPSQYKDNFKFTDLNLKINIDDKLSKLNPKNVDITNLHNILPTLKDTYMLCFNGVNFSRYNQVSMKCGDRAILEIAKRIDKYAKDDMLTIRVGGDEFALITRLYDYDKALELGNEILKENGNTFEFDGVSYPLSLYCGINKAVESLEYKELFNSMQSIIDGSKDKK